MNKGVDIIYSYTKELSADWPEFISKNHKLSDYMILDIETTGLSPQYNQIILVGIIYAKNNQWYLTQIFCDHRTEERELLLELKTYIQDQLIITYNGYAFDIPFLNKRFKHHKIYFEINPYSNFDLYRVVRSSKKALDLPNYKLKTIEEYLGIYREDQISGKDSVLLYEAYEETRDPKLKEVILLHNADDIEYMIPTLSILDHVPEEITYKYFPYHFTSTNYEQLIINDYKVKKDYIEACFYTSYTDETIMDIANDYTISISDNILTIKLPLFNINDRKFVDVDEIDFLNLSFNDLPYNQQIFYEVNAYYDSLKMLVHILEKHS